MDNIDIFYNSEIILRRKSFKIKCYIISMTSLLIGLLVFISCFKYNPYINLNAIVIKENNSYYLKTLVNLKQINDINQKHIIISDKKYKYKIKKISENYILDEKYNRYYEVLLESNIDSKLIIDNNIINVSIEMPETTFLSQIIKRIKKEVM